MTVHIDKTNKDVRLPAQPVPPPERGGHPRGVAGQLSLSYPMASASLKEKQVTKSEEWSVTLAELAGQRGPKEPNKLVNDGRHHLGLHPRLVPGLDNSLWARGVEPWPFRPTSSSMELDLFVDGSSMKAVDDDSVSMLSTRTRASTTTKLSKAHSVASSGRAGDDVARQEWLEARIEEERFFREQAEYALSQERHA
mmetsp:Transcript_16528/g.49603  ORF Transcript_16528/g.49603 Transcript_16528/m.49603 type:complete len:196 (+) Transcript_16528:41-628(+)